MNYACFIGSEVCVGAKGPKEEIKFYGRLTHVTKETVVVLQFDAVKNDLREYIIDRKFIMYMYRYVKDSKSKEAVSNER